MTLSPTLLLIVLVGAFVGGGVVLLVNALTRQDVSPVAKPPSGLARRLKAFGTRLPIAIGVGLLVLLVTRWVVAAVATGLLILFWDALFGGAGAEKRGIAKIEALAAWTESLRDTVAGAVGLEQAIPATAYAASPIIAALILNSRLRGPGLREVLTSLSESARAELDMRQRVSAGRRSTRRSVQIVVGVTLTFVFGLRIFNPGYVEPYASPVGQVVLLVVIGVFAAGVMWLRRLSRFETPERFLHFRTAP